MKTWSSCIYFYIASSEVPAEFIHDYFSDMYLNWKIGPQRKKIFIIDLSNISQHLKLHCRQPALERISIIGDY